MPSTMRRRVSAVRPVKRSHMPELRCFMRTRLARRRIAAGMPMGRVPVRSPLSSRTEEFYREEKEFRNIRFLAYIPRPIRKHT